MGKTEYLGFIAALRDYKDMSDFEKLKIDLDNIFKGKYHLRYLILGLESYMKVQHKKDFASYCEGNIWKQNTVNYFFLFLCVKL